MFSPNIFCLTCFPPRNRNKIANGVLRKLSIDCQKAFHIFKISSVFTVHAEMWLSYGKYSLLCADAQNSQTLNSILWRSLCRSLPQSVSNAEIHEVLKWSVASVLTESLSIRFILVGSCCSGFYVNGIYLTENVGKLLVCPWSKIWLSFHRCSGMSRHYVEISCNEFPADCSRTIKCAVMNIFVFEAKCEVRESSCTKLPLAAKRCIMNTYIQKVTSVAAGTTSRTDVVCTFGVLFWPRKSRP
jgi:hypothetical protein